MGSAEWDFHFQYFLCVPQSNSSVLIGSIDSFTAQSESSRVERNTLASYEILFSVSVAYTVADPEGFPQLNFH